MPSLERRISALHDELDQVTRLAAREAQNNVTDRINDTLSDDERIALVTDISNHLDDEYLFYANLFPENLREEVVTWMEKHGASMLADSELLNGAYTPALAYPPPPVVSNDVLDSIIARWQAGDDNAAGNLVTLVWLRSVRDAFEAGIAGS